VPTIYQTPAGMHQRRINGRHSKNLALKRLKTSRTLRALKIERIMPNATQALISKSHFAKRPMVSIELPLLPRHCFTD
jgi:hypothetical protein